MNQEDLISVIVPCYNIEKYVKRCIDSIIKQTYQNLEIIAIDDGSTDDTGKILDTFAIENPIILVKHFENAGLSAARNRGMRFMHGKYVLFVDGDDFLADNAIELLHKNAIEQNVKLVACNYYLYYSKNQISIGNNATKAHNHMKVEQAISNLFDDDLRLCTAWAKLYLSDLFDDIKYPEDIYFGEDMFVIHKLFDAAQSISYLEEPLYFYNQEGTSLVRSSFSLKKLNTVRACKDWVDFCKDKYPNILELALERYWKEEINACTLLASDEYKEIYFQFKKAIKENLSNILNSSIDLKNKAKAILIVALNRNGYKAIRTILK